MILLDFQGKSFSIIVIHICVPIYNAKEAKVEQFYEDLHDLLELTPPPQKNPNKMSWSSWGIRMQK